MAPVSRSEFEVLLGKLTQEDFSLFVAELWRARGWETTVSGDRVRARSEDGDETVLWVRAKTGWFSDTTREIPSEADIVVLHQTTTAIRTDIDARVIDARELREITLYAIDRPTADALYQRFFGRPISESSSPRNHGIVSRTQTITGNRVHVLAGGAILLLLAAAILAGPLLVEPASSPPATTPVPLSESQSISVGSTNSTATQGTISPISIEAGTLPPGLSRDGITDAELMAETHASLLTGRSYKLALTYREYNSNDRISVKHEEIRVENATTYSGDIVTSSPLELEPYLIADTESYANGKQLYIREFTKYGAEYRATNIPYDWRPEGPIESRVERYLEWLLSVDDSSIHDVESQDGNQLFVIHSSGDLWPTPGTGSGITVVDSNGLVHYVNRVYSIPGTNGTRVMITIRYFDIDATTVEPPTWYPEAVNQTAADRPQLAKTRNPAGPKYK